MAITPAQCTTLNSDDLALVAKIETEIDKELLLSYEVDKIIHVRNSIVRDAFEANERVLTRIIANYEALGWTVTRYENERQGPYLAFHG